jgi:hypothetical protein
VNGVYEWISFWRRSEEIKREGKVEEENGK